MKNLKVSLVGLLLILIVSMAFTTIVKSDTTNNVDMDVAKNIFAQKSTY